MQIRVTEKGGYMSSRLVGTLLEHGHEVVKLDSGSKVMFVSIISLRSAHGDMFKTPAQRLPVFLRLS